MPEDEAIALQGPLPSIDNDSTPNGDTDDASQLEQASIRQYESTKNRSSVLLGSAVSHMPIWGKSSP